MKEDILFPAVHDVLIVVVQDAEQWIVYLLNRKEHSIENVLVTSKGYGKQKGEAQKTSTLRHMIPKLESGEFALIEPIDPSVFHLNNEYWLSFYVDGLLYDKKYIFVPDSIVSENFSYIPELKLHGVIHN